MAEETIYAQLFALRNRQRALQAESPFVIRGSQIAWETNPQGVMRWYLHPAMEKSCHKALIFFVQRIPPLGRSGKQHCQGGVVQFVVQGKGRTIINDLSYAWEAGDLVQLPLLQFHPAVELLDPLIVLCRFGLLVISAHCLERFLELR